MSVSMIRLSGFAIGLVLAFSSNVVEANLDRYDLDSLVYLSEQIVEGKIARSYWSNGWDVTEVEVASVLKGNVAKGEILKIQGLYLYQKPKPDRFDPNTVSLQEGDRLILFLVNAGSGTRAKASHGDADYWLVPSGVKMILDGKVVGFSQRSNPGPSVLEIDNRFAGPTPTRDEFGKQLSDSIVKMKLFAARLGAARASKDAPWFMEILRERARRPGLQPNRYYRDQIAELACSGLANLHDPKVLEEAIQFDRGGIIATGFGTPAGRDYILAVLQDPKQPRERKLRLARGVQDAGDIYRSRQENIEAGGCQLFGKAGVRNDDYITRIARCVLANNADEEICLALTRSINFFGRGIVQAHDADMHADIVQALSVLKQVYDTCKSEVLRFEIEAATANVSRALYDRLGSSCGPVVSIAMPVDPTKFTVQKDRSLFFCYRYWGVSEGRFTASVVFQNRGSGQKYVVATRNMPDFGHCGQGCEGGGSMHAPLPQRLPKGTYRVYLQIAEDGRVVGEGHYFETDL
jgi:hypothetical protein